MSQVILTAHIPSAGYGGKPVLQDIDLAVQQGEILALIGPNGAGKSTLLKVLMGLLPASGAQIDFDGRSIAGSSPEQNVQSGLAFVPQGNRVFTELTVQDNLEMGGYLMKDAKELKRRAKDQLSHFKDLKGCEGTTAGLLSGGEKQLLALARALMLDPKVLLLDEPSLGLSPKLVTEAFALIKELNRATGVTIVIVEQKVKEVLKIATRVMALRSGRVAFMGSPKELQEGERLKKIFLV